MRFGDILRLCRQNLWRRKSRTILTVLGVIVGCCSIVLMVSLGQGINEQNEKMLKSMGDLSIVTVYTNGYAGPMDDGGSSKMGDTKLDDKAVESFRAMSGVSGVTPMMNFPYNVTARAGAGGRYIYDYVQIMGIDMTQFDQMGYKLVGGEKPVKKDQVLAGEWFAYGFMDTLKNGEQRTSTRGDQYSSCTFNQATGQCEEDQDEDPFFDPLTTQISLTTGTNYQGDQYSMNMYGGGGGGTPATPKAEHKLYINGFTDGMFHAERNITREQTAKMLIDALEKETAEPEQSSYTDVANNRWSYRWVEAASKEGYMVGYNGGVFKPESAITRAEMATALSRIAAKEGLIMTSSTKTFSDVADGKWYSSYIRQAVQYGLISGYTDGTFRPEQYITRAETVTMINRMLGRNYETAAELHSMACPFPDVGQSSWAYGNIMEAAITHEH